MFLKRLAIVILALLGATLFARADTYSFGPLNFGTDIGSVSGSFQYDLTTGIATNVDINLMGGTSQPAVNFNQFGGGCTPAPCIALSFIDSPADPATFSLFGIEINPSTLNIDLAALVLYPTYNDLFLDGFDGSLGVATDTPSATPLPAALPLFAAGLGALGLFGWRRKRRALAAA